MQVVSMVAAVLQLIFLLGASSSAAKTALSRSVAETFIHHVESLWGSA